MNEMRLIDLITNRVSLDVNVDWRFHGIKSPATCSYSHEALECAKDEVDGSLLSASHRPEVAGGILQG
jgi:hypothetical protein